MNDAVNGAKARASSIRLRTWILTFVIITALVFYFLVNVIFNETIDWIDFAFMATIQIVSHCIYFPEGELFGTKDSAFIANKNAYNEKAKQITDNKGIKKLREYCKIEFEERKKTYIETELSYLGLTDKEFAELKKKTPKEIKHLKVFGDVSFTKSQAKRLYALIYKKLPVEPNNAETIMSAVENNGNKAIRDDSVSYKVGAYIMKFLWALGVGTFLAYVNYTLKDGITIADIAKIVIYTSSLFITAVMSFTAGEKETKVYKKNFYIKLCNFIDGFLEWSE